MEKITVDFFSKVKMISHLKKINDDLYVIGKTADKELNKNISNLYKVVDGSLQQLTFSNDVGNFDYVDGLIVFGSKRDDSKTSDFYYLPAYGEACQLVSLMEGVRSVKWITTDHFLFTATTHLDSQTFEEGEECRVFEEVPWWMNGAGDISKSRTSLFVYENGESKQVSPKTMNVSNVVLSPDQSFALVSANDFEGYSEFNNDLYYFDLEKQTLEKIELFENASYYGMYFKNNEEVVLIINTNDVMDGMENASFYLYNVTSKEIKKIYNGDPYHKGCSVGSDIKMGNIDSPLIFKEDGFEYITTDSDHAPLMHLSYDGKVSHVNPNNDHELIQEVIYEDGKYYMIMMINDDANEIYMYDGKYTKLTNINDFSQYSISTPIEMNYQNKEGMTLNGWVIKPIDYEEGKKYPTILDVHGGPKTVYGNHFFHEMQYWANEGYVVIFTNIHGSDGRGNEFCDIRGKYGTIDYDDLMCFVDACIEQFDCIDEEHMGITGGSYGGFMTNWVIGHTSRFKAAASQRSISNWVSFANISDIGYGFAKENNQATTWDHVDLLWKQSPLKYANNCTTPTLFIHSDHDYRCPMAEGMQMFYALKVHGVDARMCLFKDETHELSRSGRPLNRIRRLKEITAWMDKYLK